jgi:hypothetical protein
MNSRSDGIVRDGDLAPVPYPHLNDSFLLSRNGVLNYQQRCPLRRVIFPLLKQNAVVMRDRRLWRLDNKGKPLYINQAACSCRPSQLFGVKGSEATLGGAGGGGGEACLPGRFG